MLYILDRKSLQQKILAPINLSIIGSIALHGLFFGAVLPKWSLNAAADKDLYFNNTKVIELNELERTRLPDLSPQKFFNWDTLSSLPSNNTESSSLPPSEFNSLPIPLNNNYSFNSLPPPPSVPPLANYSVAINLPVPSSLPPPPPLNSEGMNLIKPSPNAPSQFSIPQGNDRKNGGIAPTEDNREAKIRQLLFPSLPENQGGNLSENLPTINPRNLINTQKPIRISNRPIANPVDLNRLQSINNQLNPNRNNNNPASISHASPPVTSQSPSRVSSLASDLAKNQKNTSNEEARKNYLTWVQEVDKPKPEEVKITGIYPQDACIGKLEGTTTYGIMVNPQGKVMDSQLIKSSGYELLNKKALEQIQSQKFAPTADGNKPYHVYVNYSYNPDICPSLSLSNLGKVGPNSNDNALPVKTSPSRANTGTVPSQRNPNTSRPQTNTDTPPPRANTDRVAPVKIKPEPEKPSLSEPAVTEKTENPVPANTSTPTQKQDAVANPTPTEAIPLAAPDSASSLAPPPMKAE